MKDSRSACAAILTAATEEEVVLAVRGYLSSFTEAEVALMPAGLTALGTSHAQGVVQGALELVRRDMLAALDAPGADIIRDAVLVFSTAATRLAALAAVKAPQPARHDDEARV